MKRHARWAVLCCFLSGCSTHPMTDFCDFFKPGKLGPTTVREGPYGGVAIPQGAIVPVAPAFPGAIPAPGVGVIPGPIPLPGNRPPGDFQLQPPMPPGDIPLPPPPPPAKF